MSEKERPPMDPELEKALKTYEVEVRDGTERSQQLALQSLRAIRHRLRQRAEAVQPEEEEDTSVEAA